MNIGKFMERSGLTGMGFSSDWIKKMKYLSHSIIFRQRGICRWIVLIFIWLSLWLFHSCESTVQNMGNTIKDRQFYPLHTGDFRIYQVREKIYSLLNNPVIDSVEYQLREVVAGSYLNEENDSSFILKRYWRAADTATWTIDSVWTVRKTSSNVVLNQGNTPFVKLIFPVDNELTWDGNAMNSRKEEIYKYEHVYEPYESGGISFDETTTVIQSDINLPNFRQDFRFEIYAIDVGLIYKESINLQYCITEDCFGKHIIEQGREYKQELIEYGKE